MIWGYGTIIFGNIHIFIGACPWKPRAKNLGRKYIVIHPQKKGMDGVWRWMDEGVVVLSLFATIMALKRQWAGIDSSWAPGMPILKQSWDTEKKWWLGKMGNFFGGYVSWMECQCRSLTWDRMPSFCLVSFEGEKGNDEGNKPPLSLQTHKL